MGLLYLYAFLRLLKLEGTVELVGQSTNIDNRYLDALSTSANISE